jgi:hypothetical protein
MSLETQESIASFNKVLAFLLNKQRMSDCTSLNYFIDVHST